MAEAPDLDGAASIGPEETTVAPAQGRLDDRQDLTVADAATLYDVSSATLRRLISAGELGAWQVRGQRSREWRLSGAALEAAGFRRRAEDQRAPSLAELEVRLLTEALTAERARAARLDGELGYALLTVGRLRGRLRDAGIDPDELFGADLVGDDDARG